MLTLPKSVKHIEEETFCGGLTLDWTGGDYQLVRVFEKSGESYGAWTAAADADWIGLSPAGGESGDTLTLNLAENPGQRRSSTVTVSCGTASAVIRVTQCAKLTDWPQLGSPQLSDDVAYSLLRGDHEALHRHTGAAVRAAASDRALPRGVPA